MINLSINQLLKVWGELVQAYCGKNKFGGDTAEIDACQLMPYSPLAEQGNADAQAYRGAMAARSLRNLALKFSEDFNCAVYIQDGNVSIGLASDLFSVGTRVRVKVVPN